MLHCNSIVAFTLKDSTETKKSLNTDLIEGLLRKNGSSFTEDHELNNSNAR